MKRWATISPSFMHLVLIFLQVLIGLAIYALNLRFEVVDVKIQSVERRLEDHLRAGKAPGRYPSDLATLSPSQKP